MNYAERVKELAEQYFLWQSTGEELHTAIDAMQSALDDAVAKLAARDVEVERLRKDAERYQLVRRGQHWSVIFVIDGIGDELRGEALDAAVDTVIARKLATALSKEVKDDWIEYRGRDDAALGEYVKGGE